MKRISILGAGMAGFGAVSRLYSEGVQSVLYEKKPYYGGHTASYVFDGKYMDGCLTRLGTTSLLNVTAGGGSNVPTYLVERR